VASLLTLTVNAGYTNEMGAEKLGGINENHGEKMDVG
jgi:hypothetical protein